MPSRMASASCAIESFPIRRTAWDDKLGGATGYGAALLAQWAVLEGQS